MALDATIGGASANSYITVADADLYFTDRYSSDEWDALGDEVKAKLLVTASLQLDWRVDWIGVKQTVEQAMEWPRVDVACMEPLYGTVEAPALPPILSKAVCELAVYLVEYGDPSALNDLDAIRLSRLSIDFNEDKKSGTDLVPDFLCAMLSSIGSCKTAYPKLRQAKLWR